MIYLALIKKGKDEFGEDIEKILFEKSIEDINKSIIKDISRYNIQAKVLNKLQEQQKWYKYKYSLEQIEKVVAEEWKAESLENRFTNAWIKEIKKFKEQTIRSS